MKVHTRVIQVEPCHPLLTLASLGRHGLQGGVVLLAEVQVGKALQYIHVPSTRVEWEYNQCWRRSAGAAQGALKPWRPLPRMWVV